MKDGGRKHFRYKGRCGEEGWEKSEEGVHRKKSPREGDQRALLKLRGHLLQEGLHAPGQGSCMKCAQTICRCLFLPLV